MGERLHLHTVFGVRRLRRWRTTDAYGPFAQWVEYGQLADDRWYCCRSADPGGAHVFDTSQTGSGQALQSAYRWMRDSGRQWVPAPAAYDGSGQPVDGLPWVKHGNQWVLPEPDPGG